jgi:uncharacterized protein YktB (UPF0637 family)
MQKFKGFTQKDFNSFVQKDERILKTVKNKLKNLILILSEKIGGYSSIYEQGTGRFAGYLSKSANRKEKAFFNIQINAEDLSLEFQIESKILLLKFLKNVNVRILNDLKSIGDCEIAVWDINKKVCKFYSGYLDKSNIEFLLNKLKSIKRPIFKFRKIYSRDEAREILKSSRLIKDLSKSIKTLEILYNFL